MGGERRRKEEVDGRDEKVEGRGAGRVEVFKGCTVVLKHLNNLVF